ncbi:MAG: N-acetylmuramoyl-L-alanine amidase [Firmicutes bacterium]|nr:N-acetylmuramoyl-L-alanine amidase [Bacillota bacterium]
MPRLVLLIRTRKLMWPAAALMVLLITVILIRVGLTSPIPDGAPGNLAGRRIAIDPGHGGIDGGTNRPDFLEKEVNLAVALRLRDDLIARGAEVVLTREEDIDLGMMSPEDGDGRYLRGLKTRVSIIEQNQSDLFLSIHVNANHRLPSTSGPMVFYSRKTPASRALAETLQARLNALAEEKGLKRHSAGPARFFLLENCRTTGVIVELGFMTNRTERALLENGDYQQELVQAVIEGLKDFFAQEGSVD